MKLQYRFLFLSTFLIILLMIIISFISYKIIKKSFEALEEETIKKNIERLNEIISADLENLDSRVKDWAFWDDTYNYVINQNNEYFKSNLQIDSLLNIKADIMLISNSSNNIIFNKLINSENKSLIDFYPLREYINLHPDIIEFKDDFDNKKGIIYIPESIILFSSRPIIKSDWSGPNKGTLIMAYFFNDKKLKEYEKIIKFPLKIQIFNKSKESDNSEITAKIISGFAILKDNNNITEIYFKRERENIIGYIYLNDIYKDHTAILEFAMPRSIYKEGMKTLNLFLIFLVSITIIFILITYILSNFLFKNTLNQINGLKKSTQEIVKGNYDFKININSKDEIRDLAEDFKKMAEDLNLYQQKFIQSEKEKSYELKKEVAIKTKDLKNKIEELNKTKSAILNMANDLSKANEELKDVDKTKSEFLNMISHELKTPLTALLAHLEVIDDLKKNLTKEELNSFEAVRRNANNLKILITNILEISRIESGKFELTKNKIDINKLIKESSSELEILSKQKSLKINLDLAKLPVIKVDEQRIKEILNNLITNAIKFTERGTISIKSEKNKDFIEISVSDTGIGIPEDKMKNLFQKFYQVDSSIGRRYGGSGLGLSITKKLIETHGGEITVNSKVNLGTTFKFTLPIK